MSLENRPKDAVRCQVLSRKGQSHPEQHNPLARQEDTMTGEEQELLEKYLTHLNVLGDEGDYPDFESWYQEVRYAQGPEAPTTLQGSTAEHS